MHPARAATSAITKLTDLEKWKINFKQKVKYPIRWYRENKQKIRVQNFNTFNSVDTETSCDLKSFLILLYFWRNMKFQQVWPVLNHLTPQISFSSQGAGLALRDEGQGAQTSGGSLEQSRCSLASKEFSWVSWACATGRRPQGGPRTHWWYYTCHMARERLRFFQQELHPGK